MLTSPLPWNDAVESRAVRSVLPTSLGSRELAQIRPDILERALFSARTENARHLQKIGDVVDRIISPRTEDGRTVGLDFAGARKELRESLRSFGYLPDARDRGTIRDFGSEARLNLILDVNTRMAQGAGHFAAQNDPDVLDAYPALELYRQEDREEPRDWAATWTANGGQIYEGRMIALKNDPIWTAISEFGLPYPPFNYNSGMWVRDVSRSEAERFGLLRAQDRVAPRTRGFNEDLESSPEIRDQALRAALLEDMPGAYFDEDGVLHR